MLLKTLGFWKKSAFTALAIDSQNHTPVSMCGKEQDVRKELGYKA